MTRVSHRIERQTRKITWGRLLTLILSPVTLNAAESFERLAPAYKQLRYDENYQYLRDSSLRTDFMDALKYIPLNQEGESYLTLGGEIRERYEYFHNWNWGDRPQDENGYLLQRYMIHADAHFTEHFRIFTQFKSGLEDGRNGGPRPTDEDQFDLNQLFVDGKLDWEEKDSFALRLGRQRSRYRAACRREVRAD